MDKCPVFDSLGMDLFRHLILRFQMCNINCISADSCC